LDDALGIVRELGDSHESVIVNSINPDRIAGQKTAAFEIVDVLGDAPDFHLLPVGNAGNITAYWMGYREYRAHQESTRVPSMIGFQSTGAAPIFHNPSSKSRKPSRLQFGLEIRRVGNTPARQSLNREAQLTS